MTGNSMIELHEGDCPTIGHPQESNSYNMGMMAIPLKYIEIILPIIAIIFAIEIC